MKKKIQISEGNLISLIKRIVLEQTFNDELKRGALDSALYTRPALQDVESLQQKPETQTVAPPVATGTEDMDDNQSLAQADAYRKQKLAQQKKNQNRVCKGGYKENELGPFILCNRGNYIKKLQIILGFKGKQIDGYLGPATMNVFKKQYPSVTEITKKFIDYYYNSKNEINSNNQTIDNLATINLTKQNSTNTKTLPNKSEPIDVSKLELYSNKAYSINKNNKLEIHITDKSNKVIYVTSCNLLAQNKLWVPSAQKYTKTMPEKLKETLYSEFCSAKGYEFSGGNFDGGGAGGSWGGGRSSGGGAGGNW